jgi:hypothetical protein
MAQTMTEVFDPGAIELPKVKLLGREYQLAEITSTRSKRVTALQRELESAVRDGQAWARIEAGEACPTPERSEDDLEAEVIRIECELIGVAVADEELGEALLEAFNADEVSVQYLTRTSAWMQQKAAEAAELGNE